MLSNRATVQYTHPLALKATEGINSVKLGASEMSKIRSNDAEVHVAMLPLACVAIRPLTARMLP